MSSDYEIEKSLLNNMEGENGAPGSCESLWPSRSDPTAPSTRQRKQNFLQPLRALVILFCLWGIIDISIKAASLRRQFVGKQWHSLTEQETTCYCGNSTTEAKVLGCKYDSMAQSWLPDHCRDDELLEEFEKSGPNEGGGWSFFRDANHTIPMTYEEVSLLADDGGWWYVEWDWHAAHCMYYWRKQWRSWHRSGHELYEVTTGAYEHINHCEKNIRTPRGTMGWVSIGGNH